MYWWRRRGRNKRMMDSDFMEKQRLLEEIRQAHMEWVIARQKIDYVVEKEQIDYVIFALEAAEKRYEMLLRQAKNMQINELDMIAGKALGG